MHSNAPQATDMNNSRLVYSTDSGRVTAAHETPEALEKGGQGKCFANRRRHLVDEGDEADEAGEGA